MVVTVTLTEERRVDVDTDSVVGTRRLVLATLVSVCPPPSPCTTSGYSNGSTRPHRTLPLKKSPLPLGDLCLHLYMVFRAPNGTPIGSTDFAEPTVVANTQADTQTHRPTDHDTCVAIGRILCYS